MTELEQLIDWDHVMKQPRSSGGHEEVMRSIFGPSSKVIAWWSDGDYQGTIAIAHKLADGRVVVMTDYYGSCPGCDAWGGATDEDARKQVLDLVHNSKSFDSIGDAAAWCETINAKDKPFDYPFSSAVNLLAQLKGGTAMTPTAELVSQEQLQLEIAPVIQRAQGITITDQATYDGAIDFLKEIKTAQGSVTDFFAPIVKSAHEAWKKATAGRDSFLAPLADAEKMVKAKALTYQSEQEAKREAERRRLQAEADEAARKERDRLLKKAEKLKTAEKRDALIDEAAEIAAPIIEAPATIEKAEGVATRKTWKARVIDDAAVPREYCIPNIKALDALAKSMKGKMKIAGVEFYCEESLAVGRK